MTSPVVAAAPFLSETLVLIPALDEEACVGETVQAWRSLGARRVRVIDNGSRDATGQRARDAGAEVLIEPLRGYGAAAWAGLQHWPEDCAWVMFSAADGSDQLPAKEAAQWQSAVESGAEMVLGDRSKSRSSLTLTQRIGNRLCCLTIFWGWGRHFRDLASLRLIQRRALERLNLHDRGFGWNVEMQVRALELGLRVTELEVSHFQRIAGRSKISGSFRGTFRAGSGMLRMLGHLWRLRQTRKIRSPH